MGGLLTTLGKQSCGAVVKEPEAPAVLLTPLLEAKFALEAMEPQLRNESAWPVLLQALRDPPFTSETLPGTDVNGKGNTRRQIPLVGNLVRLNAKQYESALKYRVDAVSEGWSPDTIVRADLDLRDLYRNECLSAIQDLEAELTFLLKSEEQPVDLQDALDANRKATQALRSYFARVPDKDLRAATSTAELRFSRTPLGSAISNIER